MRCSRVSHVTRSYRSCSRTAPSLDPAPGFGLVRLSDAETGEERTLWMRPALRRRLRAEAERRREALSRCLAVHGAIPIELADRFEADRVNDHFNR